MSFFLLVKLEILVPFPKNGITDIFLSVIQFFFYILHICLMRINIAIFNKELARQCGICQQVDASLLSTSGNARSMALLLLPLQPASGTWTAGEAGACVRYMDCR